VPVVAAVLIAGKGVESPDSPRNETSARNDSHGCTGEFIFLLAVLAIVEFLN